MKVPLSDQIQEAERYRDSLAKLAEEGATLTEPPDLSTRLHRAEGIVLSIRFLQTYEQQFREFMRQRSNQEAQNG